MAAIVRDAIHAGALGVSTSRTILHYTGPDRTPIAGTYAGEDELFALGDALGELDAGLFEVVPSGVLGEQLDTLPGELDWMQRLAARGSSARCACWSRRTTRDPTTGARCWTTAARAQADGAPLFVQISVAPAARCSVSTPRYHPLDRCPSFAALAGLASDEKVARLRDPSVTAAIVAETPRYADPMVRVPLGPHVRVSPIRSTTSRPTSCSIAGWPSAPVRRRWST